MHALDLLGDPVRRRLLELLAHGQRTAGELSAAVVEDFGISQPAVSQHLKALRENGFVDVRAEGTRRIYAINPAPLIQADEWISGFRTLWTQRFAALETEIARGKRERRLAAEAETTHSADRPVTPPTLAQNQEKTA